MNALIGRTVEELLLNSSQTEGTGGLRQNNAELGST